MAELLVKAKAHWMDSLKQADIDKMTAGQKEGYDHRTQMGDVIIVKPDGWKWGKAECLPSFIVVKIPDLKYEDAKKYQKQLIDNSTPNNSIIKKLRQYAIPTAVVNNAKLIAKTNINISSLEKDTFIANITKKVAL